MYFFLRFTRAFRFVWLSWYSYRCLSFTYVQRSSICFCFYISCISISQCNISSRKVSWNRKNQTRRYWWKLQQYNNVVDFRDMWIIQVLVVGRYPVTISWLRCCLYGFGSVLGQVWQTLSCSCFNLLIVMIKSKTIL